LQGKTYPQNLTSDLRNPDEYPTDLLNKEVHALATEKLLFVIPWKEDRYSKMDGLPIGRGHVQPLGLICCGNIGFLENSLWPDDDILQIEVDIRECGE
jgi:hypothetical protein